MDFDRYRENIQKTGFYLEFKVAELLKDKGWSVISNRYYVDDLTETVREIDIIAYRAAHVNDFTVYTVLLISCKKNDENLWALLARDVKWDDPNAEWRPMHVWSNHRILFHMIEMTDWKESYFDLAAQNGVQHAMNAPEVDIFAFQEMNIKSGSVKNDKAIFSSVTSLMKAQAYELSSLANRKKSKVIYQFNLLSLIDSDLYRLFFSKDNIDVIPVDQDIYITNYIIHKEPTCVRIHFMRASEFDAALADYGELHATNAEFFESLHDRFFDGVMRDDGKRSVFEKVFSNRVLWRVNLEGRRSGTEWKKIERLSLAWNENLECLAIYADLTEEVAEHLNQNKELREFTSKILQNLYHYDGDFIFDSDIPF